MIQFTPADWLKYLEARLDDQAVTAKRHSDYYDGKHKLQFATQKFREAFSRFFPPMANNWCQLVVDAATERLEVQGFRFGGNVGRSWDQQADAAAWEIWQANNMDAASAMAHTIAVKCGTAYVMVEPVAGDYPRISIEDPRQVYVAVSAADRCQRLAALKRWQDLDGYNYANLYLPDYIYKFRSANKSRAGKIRWEERTDESGPNPLGSVPIIPLENNPDLLTGGRSDLEVAEPIQDAINKLCLDMQVSSEFHAYPQRTAVGWEVPRDSNGDVDATAALKASQGSVWVSESPDTVFGTLTPGDVGNYIQPIEMYVDHLAAITRTPAYYLKGKMANLSAEALKAADLGLVYRVKRKTFHLGDGWEQVMRLAFKAAGNTERANDRSAETLWADPEAKSLGQLVDAAVKLRQSLDAPLEMCWQMIGWTPQQIQQTRDMLNLPVDGAGGKNLPTPTGN